MPDHLQPALRAAIPFINTAISDYKTLERFQQCLDALYLLAVVYHNLDMIPERNRTAEQHRKVEKERKEIVGLEVDDGLKEILDLVAGVGKMFGPQ